LKIHLKIKSHSNKINLFWTFICKALKIKLLSLKVAIKRLKL
jgi:hypothetical protein